MIRFIYEKDRDEATRVVLQIDEVMFLYVTRGAPRPGWHIVAEAGVQESWKRHAIRHPDRVTVIEA